MADDPAPELLAARALCFPLHGEAFEAGTLELSNAARHAPTERLAEAFERWVRLRADGTSLESLNQVRRYWWSCESRATGPVTLQRYLRHLARSLLRAHGAEILLACAGYDAKLLARDDDVAHQAVRWRWITFYLPADLFIAALHAEGSEPATQHVTLITPQLQKLLEREVAQTHLHVGAGFAFSDLWAGLMALLAADRAGDDVPTPATLARNFDAGPQAAQRLAERLLAAAVARVVLAAYLQTAGAKTSLAGFLGAEPGPAPFTFDAALRPLHWPAGHAAAGALLDALLNVLTLGTKLAHGGTDYTYARAQSLYRRLVFAPQAHARATAHGDPLADLFPATPDMLPETRFVAHALRYLRAREDDGRRDHAFERLFWQYQRVRSSVYGYVVQEPGTAGLDWFTRYYNRIRNVSGGVRRGRNALAIALESRDLGLGSLELRTSPAEDWKDVRDDVLDVAHAGLDHKVALEIGLVLHLIKAHKSAAGCWHRDPLSYPGAAAYGAWFSAGRRQCLAIAGALERRPALLLVLRGLDAANVELAIPAWVMAPLFRLARRASERAAFRLAREHPAWRVTPLRQTLHAGEDFRHLAEGLRRMHEPLEFGLLRAGDRLGHGFALGVDAERWCRSHPLVHQPREERLEDLLWELERYAQGDLSADAGRLARVRHEANEHARAVYGRDVDLDHLVTMRRLRFDEQALAQVGYPDGRARTGGSSAELRLLRRSLGDSGVFERGTAPVEVRVEASDAAMLRAAQAFLRRRLGCQEITVEVNPSSNLLIGDLADLESHPLFRLQPLPGRPLPEGGAVLATINDDDPLTFATKLADEYTYLYFGLLRNGVPAQEALEYLERLRQNAWRARFTLQHSADKAALREVMRSQYL